MKTYFLLSILLLISSDAFAKQINFTAYACTTSPRITWNRAIEDEIMHRFDQIAQNIPGIRLVKSSIDIRGASKEKPCGDDFNTAVKTNMRFRDTRAQKNRVSADKVISIDLRPHECNTLYSLHGIHYYLVKDALDEMVSKRILFDYEFLPHSRKSFQCGKRNGRAKYERRLQMRISYYH